MMNTQTKELYTPPRCEELDVRFEGVLSTSLTPTYPNPFNPEKPL